MCVYICVCVYINARFQSVSGKKDVCLVDAFYSCDEMIVMLS